MSKHITDPTDSRNPDDALTGDESCRLESLARDIEKLQGTATLKIAARLTEAREIFRYSRDDGGFAGWVETRLRISRQTAYNLLHVYERFGGKSVKYFDTFPASILYLLAAPSTPAEARDEVEAIAATGEKVSVEAVKEIITKAKGSEQPRKRGAVIDETALKELETALKEMGVGAKKPDAKRGGDKKKSPSEGDGIMPTKRRPRHRIKILSSI